MAHKNLLPFFSLTQKYFFMTNAQERYRPVCNAALLRHDTSPVITVQLGTRDATLIME